MSKVGTTYPSIEALYEGRPDRKLSGEVDFGVHWRYARSAPSIVYRVSWIEATGEVYAYASPGDGVEILAAGLSRDEVEEKLDGWPELCGTAESMQWVRERLGAPPRRGPVPFRSDR